jgi:hypothetical protein
MNRCPTCKTLTISLETRCPECGNNLVREAALPTGSAFASSDWVGTAGQEPRMEQRWWRVECRNKGEEAWKLAWSHLYSFDFAAKNANSLRKDGCEVRVVECREFRVVVESETALAVPTIVLDDTQKI